MFTQCFTVYPNLEVNFNTTAQGKEIKVIQ